MKLAGASVATISAAVALAGAVDVSPNMTMTVGFAGAIILVAIPITYKLSRIESALKRDLRDHRRAIFGGDAEPGLTRRMDDHARTLYGSHDSPQKGLVSRMDAVEVRRADDVRHGAQDAS